MKLVNVISELKEEIPVLVVDLYDTTIRDDESIQKTNNRHLIKIAHKKELN